MSIDNHDSSLSNEQVLQNVRQRGQKFTSTDSAVKPRIKYLLCQLNDDYFGIEATYIREISKVNTITRVPNTPDYVLGVINLRGNITAVIDIRNCLKLETRTINTQTTGRVVVCEVDGMRVGIVMEAVLEVTDVNPGLIEPPLLTLGSDIAPLCSGVISHNKGVLVLLSLSTILERLKV